MYLKSDTITRMFKTRSKNGKEFFRPRSKIVHTFSCDKCGSEFQRDRHEINHRRASNDYKHYCSKCQDMAMFADLGREKYRDNLRQGIGEKWIDSCGYIQVYMGPDYKGTGYCGSVREHVLIMEQHLGRSVEKGEVVHHIDGDKTNNVLDNLQLMTVEEHNNCHAKSESVVFELYKKGIVGYDRDAKRYFIKETTMSEVFKDKVYLHVSNSGVTFSVEDGEHGPMVSVSASTFGNLNQKFSFFTTKEGLRAMRDILNNALDHEFEEPYCHAAEPPRDNSSK